MDASSDSPSLMEKFKSKKAIHSSKKDLQSDLVMKSSDPNPWSSKTPEKASHPPLRRGRSQSTVMSLKEVRQFAQKLQRSPNPPNRLSSEKEQISSDPVENPVVQPKKTIESAKLPEKYEILDKFFSSLDSSIRLIQLKRGSSTLSNISPKIECLTDRRFSYRNLAQLKYILPEAIKISKASFRDEQTCCVKPDLHITLDVNAIQNHKKLKSESGNLQLRKIFRARLFEFFKSHPEGDEVPEEILPEPFNHSKLDLNTINPIKTSSLLPISNKQPASASHLSQSFKSRFSNKISTTSMETLVPIFDLNADQKYSRDYPTLTPVKESVSNSSIETPANLNADQKYSRDYSTLTPIKESVSNSSIETPAKLILTPAQLMSATPSLQAPKRCYMSPDDVATDSPNKLVRRPQRNRSLKFDDDLNDDILDILPDSLLDSIGEKERKNLEEQSPAITQAKRRQKMIAGLPKLFDRLKFMFQSINRSVLTKEELVTRIMSSNLDIIERRDIEEQISMLKDLAPEWIYEKSALSGDLLVGINKMYSPELIRARLTEKAK